MNAAQNSGRQVIICQKDQQSQYETINVKNIKEVTFFKFFALSTRNMKAKMAMIQYTFHVMQLQDQKRTYKKYTKLRFIINSCPILAICNYI